MSTNTSVDCRSICRPIYRLRGAQNTHDPNKYGPILRVEQETIVENVNLASNRHYNHGTIIRVYME